MESTINRRKEHPSTYFVQDRSNQEELDRLALQDQMMTNAMGGVLPEQPDPTTFHCILDVGCGTGGWLIEIARTYPLIEKLVGIDVSRKMVAQARAQAVSAGVSDRVEFHVMDALRILPFPTAFFDLVNQRFGLSFLRTWDWLQLLEECKRVTMPGGVVRITETTMESVNNSPSLTKLQHLMIQALGQAGHIPSEGVVTGIPHLLTQHGFQQIQTRIVTVEYRAGTREGQLYIENLTRIFRTTLPFLRKWAQVPNDYKALYQHMLAEIQQADFTMSWPLITAWGTR